MFGWFTALSALGKAIFVVGSIAAVSTAGALISPQKTLPPSTEPPKAAVVTTKTEQVKESIPCKSITQKDSSLEKGKKVIAQHCKNGLRVISSKVTYTDGTETDRKQISSKVQTNAVTRITKIGTYVTPPPDPDPPPPCDPNYSGCVPIASDVDCAGGSGNGPAYVAGPVMVKGSDIYGLDADYDGIGCE